MSQPRPGLQRGDTFGTVVHKISNGRTLAVKYAALMVKKFRRTTNEDQPNRQELTEVHQAQPTPPPSVQEVNWAEFETLLNDAGNKHVLINFYSNQV
jgi:hypothetical protein